MNKNFWKAAFNRAARTTAQELVTTLPVGFAITPVMIQTASWSSVWIAILCWLATGLLGGVGSLLTSIATGLPEVKPPNTDTGHITILADPIQPDDPEYETYNGHEGGEEH